MLTSILGWFMKILLIGAQGVYFNGLFLTYLISPKITHRFGKNYLKQLLCGDSKY